MGILCSFVCVCFVCQSMNGKWLQSALQRTIEWSLVKTASNAKRFGATWVRLRWRDEELLWMVMWFCSVSTVTHALLFWLVMPLTAEWALDSRREGSNLDDLLENHWFLFVWMVNGGTTLDWPLFVWSTQTMTFTYDENGKNYIEFEYSKDRLILYKQSFLNTLKMYYQTK